MRYDAAHKEKTRRRVLNAAAARFRQDGLEGVGVATLMGAAGLTHGGFYSHFPSKEALIEEVFKTGLDPDFEKALSNREGGFRGFVRRYLSTAHCANPATGCPAAALASEIHRYSPEIKAAFTLRQLAFVAHIESLLPRPDPAIAQAIFALLIGTLQLARNAPDLKAAKKILRAGERAALKLGGA